MSDPLFSVAMPAYQAQDVVARAVESVLAQTFDDWELVVVDDGSTDATSDVVRRYVQADPRVRLVRQENAGCGAARNTAVLASTGRFVLRFDADDELLPEYLERMAAFISANPGYDLYSCNGWHVAPDGSRSSARPGPFYEQERSFSLEEMFAANHIFTIAVFSREVFDRIGGIRPDVYCEDLDFWFRAFVFGGATHRYTPQHLALYTVSDSQMTADVEKVLRSRMQVYRDMLESGKLDAHLSGVARAAVERTLQDIWVYRRRNAVVQSLSRVLGPSAARRASRAIHAVGSVLRPVAARIGSVVMHRREDS